MLTSHWGPLQIGSTTSAVWSTVVYDQDDDGKDLSYILDKAAGRIMKMRRTGKVWILDAVVAKDMISPELFSRQG